MRNMMANYKINRDDLGDIQNIATSMTGKQLLDVSSLNKDTAFSAEERTNFKLYGKLPPRVESIEEQAERAYQQYLDQPAPLAKYTFLNSLHDSNETLFYYLVNKHLKEMMPIVYTPTVGESIQKYSAEYRNPRGLFISYPDQDHIEEILDNREPENVDIIVVSDSEGILGIGDQGVGGINICVGKLAVYTLCAGLNPHRVLPIVLDVGTNNELLLDDPKYLGWRHNRIAGQEYDDFIDKFVQAVRKKFPNIFLHWEDFGRDTARRNLDRYYGEMCTFNDDMQGTGAVVLAALLSATKRLKQKLSEQKIVFFGAGTSATGIADQICDVMVKEGLTIEEARERIYLIGRRGLISDNLENVTGFQKIYAAKQDQIKDWQVTDKMHISLLEVVKNARPTMLIGCSTVGGSFTEEIVKEMAQHAEYPVIFPLSNPTSNSEAVPADILKWTNGKALVATGSPFDDVDINGKIIKISQCNNAFVFPGIGLGVIGVKAKRLTDSMIWAGCSALTECSGISQDLTAPLLPGLKDIKEVSFKVAVAVAKQAIADGVAESVDVEQAIRAVMWEPQYYPYKKV